MKRTLLILSLFAATAIPAYAQDAQEDELVTKDGVQLGVTYYPSTEKKGATPIIVIPDYKDSRAAYRSLARQLQNPKGDDVESFAVLTVDLRGHGDSTKQRMRDGSTQELDAAKLRKHDFENMVKFDMAAIRGFLVGKNDEQKINLNELTIIGAGLGASVGAIWAAVDWAYPPLAVGKQGQDVKALVMVSPRWKSHGLLMQHALREPGVQRQVAMMMIFGADDSRTRADVLRIKKQVERYHPEPKSSTDKPSDLAGLGVPNTRLAGGELLSQLDPVAVDRIAGFIQLHVADEDHPWIQRRDRIQ